MMMKDAFHYGLCVVVMVGLSACHTTSHKTRAYAPMPSQEFDSNNDVVLASLSNIQPAIGPVGEALNATPNNEKKKCGFSSFHRKNTVGYELDDRRQIGLRVSPDIDMFDMSDADVEVGLTFTMALGGRANKRPKCTYGSGFYGQLPYVMHEGVDISGLSDVQSIRGYVKERLDERERRRQEREIKRQRGI